MRTIWAYRDVLLMLAVLGLLFLARPREESIYELATLEVSEDGLDSIPILQASATLPVAPQTKGPLQSFKFVGKLPLLYESTDMARVPEPRPETPHLPVPDAEFLDAIGYEGNDYDGTPPTEPLVGVTIMGNAHRATDEILKLIGTRPGDILDARQVNADFRALIAKRWFDNIEPWIVRSKAGPVLVFKVLEKSIVEE
jgi:hypothetical protein